MSGISHATRVAYMIPRGKIVEQFGISLFVGII